MMRVGVYQPSSLDDAERPVLAWDEDSTTLAVEAARLALEDSVDVASVTIVSRSPSYLIDDAQVVIARALRLEDDVPVTQIQGAGPDALIALASAGPKDLVIAVDTDGAVGAGAVIGVGSGDIRVTGRRRHSLPLRVQASGSSVAFEYDDARLMRERGWKPTIDELRREGPTAVTGVPRKVASRLGAEYPNAFAEPADGAWSAVAALGALASGSGGHLVAVDGASGVAAVIASSGAEVVRSSGAPFAAPAVVPGGGLSLSLAAYERAFDAKVGLRAGRCACGEVTFPPRRHCAVCSRRDAFELFDLAHTGTVYTIATVRTPVPNMPRQYSLAIIDVDDADVRALAHVTGAPAGSAVIGDRGRLVLRRVAQREGVPDYGFAFRKEEAA